MEREIVKRAAVARGNALEALCGIDYEVQQRWLSGFTQPTLAQLRRVSRDMRRLAEPHLTRAGLRMYPRADNRHWRPNDRLRILDQFFASVAHRPLCQHVAIEIDLRSDETAAQWLALALGCAAESGCLPQVTDLDLSIGIDSDPRQQHWPLWGSGATNRHAPSIGHSIITLFPRLTHISLAGNWVSDRLALEPGAEQLFSELCDLPLTDLDIPITLMERQRLVTCAPFLQLRRLVLRGELVIVDQVADGVPGETTVFEQEVRRLLAHQACVPELKSVEFQQHVDSVTHSVFPPRLDELLVLGHTNNPTCKLQTITMAGNWRPIGEGGPATFAINWDTCIYSMVAEQGSMRPAEIAQMVALGGRPMVPGGGGGDDGDDARRLRVFVGMQDLVPPHGALEERSELNTWRSFGTALLAFERPCYAIQVQGDAHVPLGAAGFLVPALASGVLRVEGALVVRCWAGKDDGEVESAVMAYAVFVEGMAPEAAAALVHSDMLDQIWVKMQVGMLADGLLALPAERRPGSLTLDVRKAAPEGEAAAARGGGNTGGEGDSDEVRVGDILGAFKEALSGVYEVEIVR